MKFRDFASLTLNAAHELFPNSREIEMHIKEAWKSVHVF
jgi:hypothetical protein